MKGLVLSGGGARAAYQAGALKALLEFRPELQKELTVIMGSSLGAINGVLLSAGLKVGFEQAVNSLLALWEDRTFENTFGGSISLTLIRSLKVGFLQYMRPGPHSTATAIFDPSPLRQSIDEVLFSFGGASVDQSSNSGLKTIGVMTTHEPDPTSREGLLIINSSQSLENIPESGLGYSLHYVNHLSSSHAFASAALPFVMPPVQMNLDEKSLTLIDGGIVDNLPIDPAVRFGAREITLVDTSGKRWWHDFYNEPYDTAEPWAVCAPEGSFCLTPENITDVHSKKSFGGILKESMGTSTRDQIRTFGPVWPIFKVLHQQLGEQVAFEILSYAALHQPYLNALIDLGYSEMKDILAE